MSGNVLSRRRSVAVAAPNNRSDQGSATPKPTPSGVRLGSNSVIDGYCRSYALRLVGQIAPEVRRLTRASFANPFGLSRIRAQGTRHRDRLRRVVIRELGGDEA